MPFPDYPQRSAIAARLPRLAAPGYSYGLACACLLLAAAASRFYGLSEHALRYDEIQVANNSLFAFPDVFENTRDGNSSPVIYPVLLWVVQKISVSPFSLRVLPAVASVLVVATLLLLLPRAGVDRGTAFLSGLLATVSAPAIRHAQDAREYSIDALVAALLIAGLLAYSKDGRKRLLCASLFVAPLIQYGLILFCVSVIATAAAIETVSSLRDDAPRRAWRRAIVRTGRRLFWPASLFSVSCLASYIATANYQWKEGGFGSIHPYLAFGYYFGSFGDAAAILKFVLSRTFLFFQHYLSTAVAILISLLLCAGVARALYQRNRLTVVPTLFALSVSAAALAAALKAYPFGDIRQTMYLSPILFLFSAHVLRSALDFSPGVLRKSGVILVAGFIVVVGGKNVLDDRRDGEILYSDQERNAESVLDILEKEVGERDYVWVTGGARELATFEFYYRKRYRRGDRIVYDFQGESGDAGAFRYRVGTCRPRENPVEACLKRYARDFFPGSPRPLHQRIERLWIVTGVGMSPSDRTALHRSWRAPRTGDAAPADDRGASRHSVSSVIGEREIPVEWGPAMRPWGLNRSLVLYRVDNFDRFYEPDIAALSRVGESDEILIRSSFHVYLRGGRRLLYVKEPCFAEDTSPIFYLDIFPARSDDLSASSGGRGFNFYKWKFGRHGLRYEDRCVATVELPEYDVARIRTGQYSVSGEKPTREYTNVWEGTAEFPKDLPRAPRRQAPES